MARIHVMGPYRGPGEQKTAETLSQELPDSWHVIASRSLPGTHDDLDLVVIAPNQIFLLEEKAWGPKVVTGDFSWITTHGQYPSPTDRVAHLARVLAGRLRDRIKSYRDEIGRRHAVMSAVVLSHDNLQLKHGVDFDQRELVLPLRDGEASEELQRISSSTAASEFSTQLTQDLLTFLANLPERQAPTHIREYKIEQKLNRLGYAQTFLASNDGTFFILRCVDKHGWGPGVDIDHLARREAHALMALNGLQRTPFCYSVFDDDVHQWIVTPMILPTDGRSLFKSLQTEDPPRTDGALSEEISQKVIHDAFLGLSDVHNQGLIHRGLSPRRIFLGKGLKVSFRDFLMAHLSSKQTIGPWLDGFDSDHSVSFRAPECQVDPRLAQKASDIYSLALCLAGWMVGSFDLSVQELTIKLEAFGDLGALLSSCLNPDPEQRPTSSTILELARASEQKRSQSNALPNQPAQPAEFQWTKGAILEDRYELRRHLGSGGFANTWLVFDRNTEQDRVIKVFHDRNDGASARKEFNAMSRLTHVHCARTWDIGQTEDGTVFLVNEYVEGEILSTFMQLRNPSAEAVRTVALDVLNALAYLHSNNFLHRDISPRNIIVNDSGRAKLIDFGLCAPAGSRTFAGTPAYMAPEIFSGSPATTLTDLYSLAVSFIESMLGRLPYLINDIHQFDQKTLMPPSLEECEQWGPLGESILTVLYETAQYDLSRRIESAELLADRLRMAIATRPVKDANVEVINPTVESLRRGFRGSSGGNDANRGLDNAFLRDTYTETSLDKQLLPDVLNRTIQTVLLTGNPGDGKTAFLVTVQTRLNELGGHTLEDNPAGWKIRLDEHIFVAVYDASESHEGMSSDDLLHHALTPEDGVSTTQRTVLLAINDGRLKDFFEQYEHLYPEHARVVRSYFDRKPNPLAEIALVDLKRRALITQKLSGLAVDILLTLTNEDRWSACESCSSKHVCPINRNVHLLRGSGTDGFAELVLTSHLRRQRRATVRDLRSAVGWLITGDLSCETVHKERANQVDLSSARQYHPAQLAFDSRSSDYLIEEWSLLDPGNVNAPEIARSSFFLAGTDTSPESLEFFQRKVFFQDTKDVQLTRQSVRSYKYLDEFCSMLEDRSLLCLKRLLLGMSRIVGSTGFAESGLAIAVSETSKDWAILKVLPESQFSLGDPEIKSRYIETQADHIVLHHNSGAQIPISLDAAEVIFRAADGEIFSDVYSDVIRQELEGFTSQLVSQPSESVYIVDELGSAVVASLNGPQIVLSAVEHVTS